MAELREEIRQLRREKQLQEQSGRPAENAEAA